jgi:hypothetical protein
MFYLADVFSVPFADIYGWCVLVGISLCFIAVYIVAKRMFRSTLHAASIAAIFVTFPAWHVVVCSVPLTFLLITFFCIAVALLVLGRPLLSIAPAILALQLQSLSFLTIVTGIAFFIRGNRTTSFRIAALALVIAPFGWRALYVWSPTVGSYNTIEWANLAKLPLLMALTAYQWWAIFLIPGAMLCAITAIRYRNQTLARSESYALLLVPLSAYLMAVLPYHLVGRAVISPWNDWTHRHGILLPFLLLTLWYFVFWLSEKEGSVWRQVVNTGVLVAVVIQTGTLSVALGSWAARGEEDRLLAKQLAHFVQTHNPDVVLVDSPPGTMNRLIRDYELTRFVRNASGEETVYAASLEEAAARMSELNSSRADKDGTEHMVIRAKLGLSPKRLHDLSCILVFVTSDETGHGASFRENLSFLIRRVSTGEPRNFQVTLRNLTDTRNGQVWPAKEPQNTALSFCAPIE